MPREAYQFFGCSLSKDFCRLIWCPPSLFGANVWSCCGGLPPREYLRQKLAVCFGDPHCKYSLVERRPTKISVETHGAGGKPDDCPPSPDLPCLFDPVLPELAPVVSAGSELDGRSPRLPTLEDESVGCFCCCFCCCYCCYCCSFLFSTCVTSEAAALAKNSSKVSNLPQAGVIGPSLFFRGLRRPAQGMS